MEHTEIIKPDWPKRKTEFIEKYLQSGKPIEDIQWYIDADLSASLWFDILVGFEDGFSLEQIDFYAKQDFDMSTLITIKHSLRQGVPLETLQIYALPRLSSQKVDLIDKHVRKKYLTTPQLKYLVQCAKTYSLEQLNEIAAGLEDGLSIEALESYVKEWCTPRQLLKERYKLQKKKKDSDYRSAKQKYREAFFATQQGMMIQAAFVLIGFLFFNLCGIYYTQNPTMFSDCVLIETAMGWISAATKYLFIAFAVVEALRGLLFLLTPHPDTSLRHILNAVVSILLMYLSIWYLPNIILVIGFQFLIMAININIYTHLMNIKYYS